jgi:hypothetical protein
VANQKELFGEGFKGDKTFLLIILLAKWVYILMKRLKKLRVKNNHATSLFNKVSNHMPCLKVCD